MSLSLSSLFWLCCALAFALAHHFLVFFTLSSDVYYCYYCY